MKMPEPRPAGDSPLRPEIATSWQRAMASGLAPDTPVDRLTVVDVDRTSRLMRAAGPVLDQLTTQLEDTALSLALADSDCRIIDLRFTDGRVGSALEQISAVPGSRYTEDVSGTNCVATPFETRQGLVINGTEHFLEPFKKFSCYGQPIMHPVTHRLEGVLDITGIMPQANPLFVPFIQRAVQDIERRLLDGARRSERDLLAAFQAAAQHRSRAVVVLGDDVALVNPVAVDLLEAADHALLRTVAADLPGERNLVKQFRLASGRVMSLAASRISGTNGTLFQLAPTQRPSSGGGAGRGAPLSSVDRQLRRLRGMRSPVLISGEPGTGRTTAVHAIADANPVVTLDCAQVPSLGERAWARRLEQLAARHEGVLAVEDIQLLPDVLCVRLSHLLGKSAARVVLTSAPRDQLDGNAEALAASCAAEVAMPPLRNRRDELPAMVRKLLGELRPDNGLRFTPSALSALAANQWPGNLRELRMVVSYVAEARSAGDVTVADLPESHRGNSAARTLTPWEQAEHDAIVGALRATGGNKLQAAERLGISRSTLYNRIRALKITA